MTDHTWRTCRICGETKPISMFYRDKPRKKDGRVMRRFDCRECARRASRESYRERQEFLVAYKLEKGCVDCGYNAHSEALDFDHLPGTEKKFTLAQNHCNSWENLLEEIAKCEVVCSNCHRVRTRQRRVDYGESAYHDLRKMGITVPGEVPVEKPFEQLRFDLGA